MVGTCHEPLGEFVPNTGRDCRSPRKLNKAPLNSENPVVPAIERTTNVLPESCGVLNAAPSISHSRTCKSPPRFCCQPDTSRLAHPGSGMSVSPPALTEKEARPEPHSELVANPQKASFFARLLARKNTAEDSNGSGKAMVDIKDEEAPPPVSFVDLLFRCVEALRPLLG